MTFIHSKGFSCLAVTSPSVDAESGACTNHHELFTSPDSLIIEFLNASALESGAYIVDIGLYPASTNAFPVSIKAKRVLSSNIVQVEDQKEDASLMEWKNLKHAPTW